MDGEYLYALVITQLSRRIDSGMNRTLEKFGLTQSQLRVLLYIRSREREGDDKIYQKDIEKCLMLSNPAVSGILQRLESKGLAERRVSFSDCRHKEIHTTEQARELEEMMLRYRSVHEEMLMEGISAEERETLKKCLERMLDNCLKYGDGSIGDEKTCV